MFTLLLMMTLTLVTTGVIKVELYGDRMIMKSAGTFQSLMSELILTSFIGSIISFLIVLLVNFIGLNQTGTHSLNWPQSIRHDVTLPPLPDRPAPSLLNMTRPVDKAATPTETPKRLSNKSPRSEVTSFSDNRSPSDDGTTVGPSVEEETNRSDNAGEDTPRVRRMSSVFSAKGGEPVKRDAEIGEVIAKHRQRNQRILKSIQDTGVDLSAFRARRERSPSEASLFLYHIFLENLHLDPQWQKAQDKGINWISIAETTVLCVLILTIISISYLVIFYGFHMTETAHYLLVSFATFFIVQAIIHPFFIMVVAFIVFEKNPLFKTEADFKFKACQRYLYSGLKIGTLLKSDPKRTVSYKHTYLSTAWKFIYRKHTRNVLKELGVHIPTVEEKGVGAVGDMPAPKRGSDFQRSALLFIFVVVVIINFQSGDVLMRYQQTSFLRQLLQVGRAEVSINTFISIDDFWNHLKYSFHMKTHNWLSNANTTTSFNSLPNVRIRQLRVQPYDGNCTEDFNELISPRCHFDIERSKAEFKNYALSWGKITKREVLFGPFKNEEGEIFNTWEHRYPSDGYNAMFSVRAKKAEELDYLKSRQWIDEYTRAVRVDLALFNADTQLVTSIVHVYEFNSVGISQDTPQVYSFPLFYNPTQSIVLRGFMVVMLILTVHYIKEDIVQMQDQGLMTFLKKPMSWINIIERGNCVIVMILFVQEYYIRKQAILDVQNIYFDNKDSQTYIDFTEVSDIAYKITSSSCVLALTVFLKVILQTRNIGSLLIFLELVPPVLAITYIPFLAIMAFSSTGYLLFSDFSDFRSVTSSTYTVTGLLLNQDVIPPLTGLYRIWGPLFIGTSMSILNYVIVNYYIILLNEKYSRICEAVRIKTGGKVTFLDEIGTWMKHKTVEYEELDSEEEMVDHSEDNQQIAVKDSHRGFDFTTWIEQVQESNK
ncbi:uncharacterized protein LOC131934524 [Physella acuta]|uniref:uncharacterized protein LOC131934524 n=1 Tax=Physella acuta TaxID=109671 RepID=UPI0027DE8498|nr:uncharacterized protein LOC131934524 [Physella acuta]